MTNESIWVDLDKFADEGIEKLKKEEFIPNLIIGETRGGAIFGRIMAYKLGIDFQVDYRKKRMRYSRYKPQIENMHSKILIVDYICDTGRTFLESMIDVYCDLYPKEAVSDWFYKWLNDEVHENPDAAIRRKFPEHELRLYAVYFNEIGSQIDINYYNIDNLNDICPDEGWKTDSTPNLDKLSKTDFPWKTYVYELLKVMSKMGHERISPEINLHKNSFLKDELLLLDSNIRFEEINVSYEVILSDSGKSLERDVFKKDCEELKYGLDDRACADGELISKDIRGKWYYAYCELKKINDSDSRLTLTFPHQTEYRTIPEMCKECELLKQTLNKVGTGNGNINECFICEQYIRTIEFLYYLLEKYLIKDIRGNVYTNNKNLFEISKEKIIDNLSLVNR